MNLKQVRDQLNLVLKNYEENQEMQSVFDNDIKTITVDGDKLRIEV